MKPVLVILLIVIFLLITYLFSRYFQQLIKPRQSFLRLGLYMLMILGIIFLVSFLMIFSITRLYPSELIK